MSSPFITPKVHPALVAALHAAHRAVKQAEAEGDLNALWVAVAARRAAEQAVVGTKVSA